MKEKKEGENHNITTRMDYGEGASAHDSAQKPLHRSINDDEHIPIAQSLREPYSHDGGLEGGADEMFSHSLDAYSVGVRHGFIRKVFGILLVQLLVTFGFVLLCVSHKPTNEYMRNNSWPVVVGITFSLVTIFAMVCFPMMARNYPSNYIMLSVFTIAEALMLGSTTVYYEADSVALAVGMTLGVVSGLILFASQTKYDFTGMGVYLFLALWVMIIFGLVSALTGLGGASGKVYAVFGTLLFSMYVVYDTQLIIGGKHAQQEIGVDDYVFAALSLVSFLVHVLNLSHHYFSILTSLICSSISCNFLETGVKYKIQINK